MEKIIKLEDSYYNKYEDTKDASEYISVNEKDYNKVIDILNKAIEVWVNDEDSPNIDYFGNCLGYMLYKLKENNITYSYVGIEPDYIIEW